MIAPKDKYHLDYDTAHHFLKYNATTGVFRWRVDRRHAVQAGDIAGSLEKGRYRRIYIDGRFYKAHRLAWLMMTGKWPKEQIDHINRDPSDNRFANLREATHSENQINSHLYRNNKTGHRHVRFHKATGKYAVEIKRNGKAAHLGLFTTVKEATKFLKTEKIDASPVPK